MKSHSQAGQDAWVHDLIGDSGYFVDVGAHDGVVHSNTYALEQLGWTGICVEPNKEAFFECAKNRKAFVWPVLVSSETASLPFDGVRVGSGDHKIAAPLTHLLDCRDTPPVIDYLSIDVEGHELEVLAGMDFDRWHVRLITIEHNLYCDGPARKNAINDILIGHGFELMVEDVVAEGYGPYENWYVNVD